MINMSDRIKRLAQKMEGLLPYPETLQHLYDNLGEVMFKQKDYFEHIKPEDRIKLLFYILRVLVIMQKNNYLIY